MKKILSKYPKEEIPNLPRAAFEGRIITIESEAEAVKAVDYLLAQDIIGFDTETKPNFKGGPMNPVALLQVSSRDTCFLFRLNHMGLPDCILRLLSDRTVLKIGLSWHDDINQLHRRKQFEPGDFVELQQMVGDYGIKDLSLQKLYANVFGQKISKTQRLTNWEADVLTEAQKVYAATDAWACVKLYEELERMRAEGYELEIVPEPEPVQPQKTKEEKEADKAKEQAKRKQQRRRKGKGYDPRKKKKASEASGQETVPPKAENAKDSPDMTAAPSQDKAEKAPAPVGSDEKPAPVKPRAPRKRKPVEKPATEAATPATAAQEEKPKVKRRKKTTSNG